jgi:AcrR family transcriptional regulator
MTFMPVDRAMTLQERARRYSSVQHRTISVALDLFADHGVGGTSLQMIADSLGVTKAAVYHQFKTKEAIMLAVAEVELEPLETALEEAEAEGTSLAAREALLSKVLDVVLERRHAVSTLQHDPVLVRLLGEHEPFRRLWVRLFTVLLGGETSIPDRVQAAALSAVIGGTIVHPFVQDIDNETLKVELQSVIRRLIFPSG